MSKKAMARSVKNGILLVVFVGIVWLISHLIYDKMKADGFFGVPEASVCSLSIGGREFSLNLKEPGYAIMPDYMTSERDIEISIAEAEKYDIKLNGSEIKPENDKFSVKVDELTSGNWIQLALRVRGATAFTDYGIEVLPPDLPKIEYNGVNPEAGFYYLTLNQYAIKMNQDGKIIYWRTTGDPTLNCFDFKATKVNDRLYYSVLVPFEAEYIQERGYLEGVYYTPVRAIVMDIDYRVIDTVDSVQPHPQSLKEEFLDMHDFVILGENHYLTLSYVGQRVHNIPKELDPSPFGTEVAAAVICEVKDGKTVWAWNSTDHPGLYALSVEGNDYAHQEMRWADYAHINSVAVDHSDNNLIASFRNLDAVLKINRTSGAIEWILGGSHDQFGLTEEQKFHRQHTAFLTDEGTITIFNNGNRNPLMFAQTFGAQESGGLDEDEALPVNEGQSFEQEPLNELSSVVEVKLNEKKRQLVSYNSYSVNARFSGTMGSVQKLTPGRPHYVMGWGGSVGIKNIPLFSEVDFGGNEIIAELYMYNQNYYNYRVYKFPW